GPAGAGRRPAARSRTARAAPPRSLRRAARPRRAVRGSVGAPGRPARRRPRPPSALLRSFGRHRVERDRALGRGTGPLGLVAGLDRGPGPVLAGLGEEGDAFGPRGPGLVLLYGGALAGVQVHPA